MDYFQVKKVKIDHLNDGKDNEHRILSTATCPMFSIIAVSCSDGTIGLYDCDKNRSHLIAPLIHKKSNVSLMIWLPKHIHLLIGFEDGSLGLYRFHMQKKGTDGRLEREGIQSIETTPAFHFEVTELFSSSYYHTKKITVLVSNSAGDKWLSGSDDGVFSRA